MYFFIRNINDYNNDYLNEFSSSIYAEKRNRIDKYKRYDDKKRSIIGEIIISELLNKYYKIDYKSLNIVTNKYGKPLVTNINIFFNISHSSDLIAGIVCNNEVGIDVEKVKDVSDSFISQYSTKKEIDYISSDKRKAFEIFCLKEAYFKMKGTDLSNLLSIEFSINDSSVECSEDNVYCELHYLDNYIIAICKKNS